MSSVKLYNAWFCPFAQRAWIALLQKGVPFDLVEQDPYDKSPEWLAVNPRGLVPAIVHNGRSIYESQVCVEYVEDYWSSQAPHLMPKDPYGKARARIWADFISKKIIPKFYLILMNADADVRKRAHEDLLSAVQELVANMAPDGPFFDGDSLGLVDIMLIPFAWRADVILQHYRGVTIPSGPGDSSTAWQRYQKWLLACLALPSIQKTLPSKEKLIAKYERYADNTAKSEVADAIRQGSNLP